jgi:hypothetical protein
MEHGLLRGINWAPNSSDQEEVLNGDDAMEGSVAAAVTVKGSVAAAVDDLIEDSSEVEYVEPSYSANLLHNLAPLLVHVLLHDLHHVLLQPPLLVHLHLEFEGKQANQTKQIK